MEKKFTPSQQNAILARGCDLAVSAAAGSGKTTVLTERILSLLSDPNGIDAAKLVVVTFTKAAAQELEDRLYGAISERVSREGGNSLLSRQLFRLSRAQISTIHSFAFSLIREYKKELGLGERVRIADPLEATLLQKKAVEEALEEFLAHHEEASGDYREALYRLFGTGRSSAGLSEAVIRIQQSAASYPGGIGLLCRRHEEMQAEWEGMQRGEIGFASTRFGKEIEAYAREITDKADLILEALCTGLEKTQLLAEKYLPDFLIRREKLAEAKDCLQRGNLIEAGNRLAAMLEERLPVIRSCPPEEADIKELCKETYAEEVKKPLLRLAENMLGQSEAEIGREMEETLHLTRALLNLASLAEEKYDLAKREKDLVDYKDLEHMTLSLVMEEKDGEWVKTPLAQEIALRFDAVFVDEYQDTNAIQDMIFRAISREGNLFVVGDPKQSIYRFRGAEPTIFSRYKNDLPLYPSGKGGMQKILLSENFRCDRSVIEIVNDLFRVIMDERDPDSLYGEEDRLRYSKIPKEGENTFSAELVLVQKPEKGQEEEEAAEDLPVTPEENREAAYLAGRIASILDGELEKSAGVPFEPSEIAVICRTHLQIGRVKEALEARGIPTTAEAGESLKEDPEYLFLVSLFSALDNPTRDVPLIAALSSPVFRFSADALYRIRKHTKGLSFYNAMISYGETGEHGETREKCRETLAVLSELRALASETELSAFLFLLYRRFGIDLLYPRRKGMQGQVKELLFAAAQNAVRTGIGDPGAFCRYLQEAEFAAPDGGDGVRLMTIHKSKGLEFPIVFVSFLAQGFSTRDEAATLLISPSLGLQLSLPKLEGRAKMNPLPKKAAKLLLRREAVEEEKRVLYVAMTRAKNKLILTASPSSEGKVKRELFSAMDIPLSADWKRSMVQSASSPLSMLLPALREKRALLSALESGKDHSEENFEVKIAVPAPFALREAEEERGEQVDFSAEKVLSALDFRYDESVMELLPKKLSVSEILQREREEDAPEFYPRRLLDFEKGMLLSGAEKIGTATHQVMQFASFSALEQNPEAEFHRLVERGFLTPEDMALVEKEKVIGFFKSALYARMKVSPNVEHERRFNVLFAPSELGMEGEGEILVQGVVDAWFENPDGTLTLMDFKTDRVRPENGEAILISRHAHQLRLYASAVEKMTGKKVKELYLYSFALSREVSVSLLP